MWRMLIGVVYIAGGGYLVFHPRIALESFAVVLAVIFVLEGVLEMRGLLTVPRRLGIQLGIGQRSFQRSGLHSYASMALHLNSVYRNRSGHQPDASVASRCCCIL